MENFFAQISATVESCKGNSTIVLGDINASVHVGLTQTGNTNIGKLGLGELNH